MQILASFICVQMAGGGKLGSALWILRMGHYLTRRTSVSTLWNFTKSFFGSSSHHGVHLSQEFWPAEDRLAEEE
jgi:hypothetical protein